MATTATTPNELYEAIDSTLRNQTVPNSITPTTHSDLLYNLIEVLSAATSTTGATLVGETIYFNRVDALSAYTVNLSTIDSSSLPLSGGTITGGLTANTFNIQSVGTGTSINTLGVDASGNVVNASIYDVYIALVTQTGSTAPTVTVLENTLGVTPSHVYSGTGAYSISASTSAFTANKTTISFGNEFNDAVTNFAIISSHGTLNTTSEIFYSVFNDSLARANNILLNTKVEIRVYN